jgi:DNA-binding transcriptional LysR family regulator
MELRQLEFFLAVARERHFTRAARRMNIVQSGLSASIRSLEQELKAELFVRSTRHVELTAAGQVFYEKAQLIVMAAKDAREAVVAVQRLSAGKLSIGTMQSLGPFIDLPVLLERFHALHPNVEIQLSQGGSTILLERLKQGELDLAFAPVLDPPRGIDTMMIACEDLVLACPTSHRLSGRKNVSLSQLRVEAFVDFHPSWGTRLIVDRAFADARIERRIAFEVTDLSTLLDLVARGLGVALVPEPIAQARARQAHAMPIAIAELGKPGICWELVLAFSSRNGGGGPKSPAGRAFVDVLKKARELP